MSDQQYDKAVANALKMALQAELDCDTAVTATSDSCRPTAADTWSLGETKFTIEISGHELLASIPSTHSSVSDPNEVDESEYDRDGDASSFSEEEDEYYEDDDDDDDDDDDGEDYDEDDDQGGEYDDDYQYTRGDFDQEPPTKELAKCKVDDEQEIDAAADSPER